MGRSLDGSAPRNKLVAFRLNPEEDAEMIEKMTARNEPEVSRYFRTLMHEDEGPR